MGSTISTTASKQLFDRALSRRNEVAILGPDAEDDIFAGVTGGSFAITELNFNHAVLRFLENERAVLRRAMMPLMRFIGGLPKKPATKRFFGSL